MHVFYIRYGKMNVFGPKVLGGSAAKISETCIFGSKNSFSTAKEKTKVPGR